MRVLFWTLVLFCCMGRALAQSGSVPVRFHP